MWLLRDQISLISQWSLIWRPKWKVRYIMRYVDYICSFKRMLHFLTNQNVVSKLFPIPGTVLVFYGSRIVEHGTCWDCFFLLFFFQQGVELSFFVISTGTIYLMTGQCLNSTALWCVCMWFELID